MSNINAIKFLSEGASIISLAKDGEPLFNISLEYSYDGVYWSDWDFSALTIDTSDTLYIRGYNPDGFSYWNEDKTYYNFIIEGDNVSCSGNIMSLIDYKKMTNIIPCEYCFYGLFKDCTSLKTAPELPATIIKEWCYSSMFNGCSSLAVAPELPAKKLVDFCYAYMFKDCTSLKTAPDIPVVELANYCCGTMFDGCNSMFSGCTFLKDNK